MTEMLPETFRNKQPYQLFLQEPPFCPGCLVKLTRFQFPGWDATGRPIVLERLDCPACGRHFGAKQVERASACGARAVKKRRRARGASRGRRHKQWRKAR